ncbi:MAG: aminotransferase class I/II-fold pyridoxal phosphate-dependent enzyme [Oscillospiraceae bacterium]|nr:aminotransferase class I/II-fold pyridoxal phosphate-dependent enzyme [Oscillospiraceae bacterium]
MQPYEHGGNVYAGPPVTVDFSSNLNPLGMPDAVKQALTADPARFEIYPDPACTALRRAVAAYHGLDPEDILPGNGADDMIYRLCTVLRPKKVLLTAPSFSEYAKAARAAGAELKYHALREADGFAVTEAFCDDITPDVDLVWLCTPNNPTGRTVSPPVLRRAAERCEALGVRLVVDECFLCFTDAPSCTAWLPDFRCLAVLDAFTKRFAMAGLRLGYLMSRDHALLERLREGGPCWNVSGPAQAGGVAALRDPEPYMARARKIIDEEARWLSRQLSDLGMKVYSPEANYVFFRSPFPLAQPLRARGLLIRSCANYPGLGEGYFRVCVHTHEKNVMLIEALREVLHG